MLLLALLLLNIIYITFFFMVSIRLNVTMAHYFLGFGPKLFSFRVRDVTFSVGFYIPIIGLARIYTVIDGAKRPMKYPWEFFDKPLIRRWVVTLSGAVGLFFVGAIIFIALAYFENESIISKEEVNRNGIYPSKQALKYGFQKGDKVIAINGEDYTDFYKLVDPKVITQPGTYYTILRDNKKINIPTPMSIDSLEQNQFFFSLLVPFVVDIVTEGSPAEKAGLLKGDRILKVNDRAIIKRNELDEAFMSDEDNEVMLTVKRGKCADSNTFDVMVTLDDDRKLGVYCTELINYTVVKKSFPQAVWSGVRSAAFVPVVQMRAFIRIFTGTLSSKKSLSGPVGIASAFGGTYWRPVALLAANVILLNFLPLPMSAFWEMIPLAYEGITRRQFSAKLFVTLRWFAILLLVALMMFTFIMDISRLF